MLNLKLFILPPDEPLRTTSEKRTTDKITALRDERFAALGDSSKNYFSLCKFLHTY
jgi:hypothetical protein